MRKTELVRRLYHWELSRDSVVRLFRIIDAIVGLPEPLEFEFEDAVNQIERKLKMPYVTSIERVQLRRERTAGREEGRRETANVLENLITRKFGELPDWAKAHIAEANDTTLHRWLSRILDAQRIEDIFA